jgi:hypothetical protein
VIFNDIQAKTSAGVKIKSSAGVTAITIGAGGPTVTTADGVNVGGNLQVASHTTLTTASATALTLANRISYTGGVDFSAANTAGFFNLAPSTLTIATASVETYDTSSSFSMATGSIYLPNAGLYAYSVTVSAISGFDGLMLIQLVDDPVVTGYINSTQSMRNDGVNAQYFTFSGIIYLPAGNYLFRFEQLSAGTISAAATGITMTELRKF